MIIKIKYRKINSITNKIQITNNNIYIKTNQKNKKIVENHSIKKTPTKNIINSKIKSDPKNIKILQPMINTNLDNSKIQDCRKEWFKLTRMIDHN